MAEEQELDEEGQLEIIANEHTRSLSSSPRESGISPLHHGSLSPHEGIVTTNEHTRSLSSSPRASSLSPTHHGATTVSLSSPQISPQHHGGSTMTNQPTLPLSRDLRSSRFNDGGGGIAMTHSLSTSPQSSPVHQGGAAVTTASCEHVRESSADTDDDNLGSACTTSMLCSQDLAEEEGEKAAIAGTMSGSDECKSTPDGSLRKETSGRSIACSVSTLGSGNSAVTLDEGIASKTDSLTSVSDSSGDHSSGSEGGETNKSDFSAIASCSELVMQERRHQALF